MYMVSAPNGFSFECVELGDAVSLADSLRRDLDVDIVVVDEDNCEVVYTTCK
jgi:hypothetical protein